MSQRNYGQYCGLARAADLVGERWALLVIRELLVAPASYGALKEALPRIPTNVLATRLKELEASGVVERRPVAGRRGVEYALTDFGRGLDPIVLALGQWGAQRLGDPRDGEVVSPGSICMALRTTFRAGRREPLTVELALPGFTVSETVTSDACVPGLGERPDADLHLVLEPVHLKDLFMGTLTPDAAVAAGVGDDADALTRFVAAHRIG